MHCFHCQRFICNAKRPFAVDQAQLAAISCCSTVDVGYKAGERRLIHVAVAMRCYGRDYSLARLLFFN